MTKPSQAESTAPVAGESDSTAYILESIQRESKEIRQLQSALESPDQSTRIAAFNALVNSGNPSWEEMAINRAFASADEATKALAIRTAFKRVQVVEVELTAPDDDLSERAQKDLEYARQSRGATLNGIEYDIKTGKFVTKDVLRGKGQVSGRNISFSTTKCSGSLDNKEGTWEFHGKVHCNKSVFDGKFTLR